MKKFKRLKRELVCRGKIVDFYQDRIQVPNGNIVTWDFLKHRGAAAVLPVMEDGKLVFVRQYRNSVDQEILEIPAGGLNGPDEPTIAAAGRELQEETGLICDTLEPLLSLYTTVAFCDEKIDIYLAKELKKGSSNPDEDEFIQVECYTVEEALDMIYSGIITDSKTIAAVLAYVNKNTSGKR